jgi:type VII secretion-associated serine protease mycosin
MTVNRRLARRTGRLAAALLAIVVVLAPSTPAASQPGDWWHHHQWQLEQVWQITNGTGVTVAILDTGVDATVAELADVVLPGLDLSEQAPDGRTDHDPRNHGTRMALLVAGNGAVTGLPGVAHGATILPIVDTDYGTIHRGNFAHKMQAIQYAVDQGAHVINMSTGALGATEAESTCPPEVADAVRYAVSRDVIVVAAAGNRAGGVTEYPASCPGVLTIGAIDQQGQPWEDSHRSSHVDLAAPGVSIPMPTVDGQVFTTTGTSNSSALVSGAVALLRAHYPDASADELVTRLLHTAHDVGEPGHDHATGYGIVDLLAALTATIPPDAPNPVYEPLGDLTNVPPPTIAPPPPPPERVEAQPMVRTDNGGSGLLPIILLATGALLALAAAAAMTLHLRSRRR